MLTVPYLKTYIIAFMAIFLSLGLKAQYMNTSRFARMDELSFRASSNFHSVRPSESFGQKITIYNNSDQPSRFRLELRNNKYFKLLYSTGQVVNVPAHDSVTVGLKFLNINARVNGVYTVYIDLFNLDDETDRKTYDFNVEVYDGSDQQFVIQPLQENVYLEKKARDFEVPVMMKNMLPDEAFVHFELQNATTSPYRISSDQQKGVRLPGKDTLINLRILTPAQMMELTQGNNRQMTIYMKNDKGDMLGMFTVYPRWLFNTGNLLMPGMSEYGSNALMAETHFTSYGRGLYSTDVQIGKAMGEGDGLGFNVYYQQFMPTGFKVLSNTFLKLQKDNLAVQLGNISDYHELSLFGRGFKGQMFLGEDKSQSMEFWAVDEQYNLLDPFSMKRGTKVLSTRYNNSNLETGDGFSYSASYFIRNEVNSTGHLHFATYHAKIGKKQQLSALVGGSMEKFNYTRRDSSLLGYSARLDYSFTGTKIQAYLSAYHSSRDYAGILQGATNITALANYNLSARLNLSYQLIKSTFDKPGYTDSSIQGRYFYNYTQHSLQTGYNAGKLKLFAKSYLLQQGQLYTLSPLAVPVASSSSARLQMGVNLWMKKFSFSSFIDGGHFTSTNTPVAISQFSTRLSLSMSGYGFSWITQSQVGPYFLNDVMYLKGDPNKFRSVFTSLTYEHVFFNKLMLMSSVNFNRSTNFSVSQTYFMQNVDYKLGRGFTATSYILISRNGQINNTQFRIGVRKVFNMRHAEDAPVSLRMRIFLDMNNNKIKDAEESWAEGVIMRMDDLNLITGSDGYIQLKNVGKGWHKFSLKYSKDNQQSSIEQSVDLDRNEYMEVGIPPQFEVKGKVVEGKSHYLKPDESLEGIRIAFRQGNKEFYVYTQKDGQFRSSVPPGKYLVSIEQLKKLGYAGVEKEIVVKPSTGFQDALELTWQNNERKVEIKKINKQP